MKEMPRYGSQVARDGLMGLDGLCELLLKPLKLPWVVALTG